LTGSICCQNWRRKRKENKRKGKKVKEKKRKEKKRKEKKRKEKKRKEKKRKEKKRKEKKRPFSVNLMRSQVKNRAAQGGRTRLAKIEMLAQLLPCVRL